MSTILKGFDCIVTPTTPMTSIPPDVIYDPRFRVELLQAYPNPNQATWQGMHQCYSEEFVYDEKTPSERKAGEICVKRLLDGHRGHFGPTEHIQITFAVGGFPHSVMQQARTHRIGVSFDVQSMRYTGSRMHRLRLAPPYGASTPYPGEPLDIDDLIYLRPVGHYSDRQGKKYEYTHHMREQDQNLARTCIEHYNVRVLLDKMAEEQARGLLPFDFRQNFVVSFNIRSLMHFLTVRGKADAQDEIRQMCIQILPHFQTWTPELFDWFMTNQWLKGRLAP